MGIKQLTKLIQDYAPGSMRYNEMKAYFNRKVAIDASTSLYQFLVAVRTSGQDGGQLTNEAGEITSHLQGMFYRTIRMMENGLKPVFVFDGKAPEMKGGELEKRKKRRAEAREGLEKATENGEQEEIEKFQRRLVHVTKEQNEDCKRLLRLMGCPCIDAPTEAESQCAELVKSGRVYATGTEDMDALTFGSNILLRRLTFSAAKKLPIMEIDLKHLLEMLGLTMDQFIDVCILCGCDYTTTIKGIGPQKAYQIIKSFGTIENAIANLNKEKYTVPEDFNYEGARDLFKNPVVTPGAECNIKFKKPNEEGIIQFLCTEKGFAEDRIRSGLKRLKKARQSSGQQRMESFFKVTSVKRKNEPSKALKLLDTKKKIGGEGPVKKKRKVSSLKNKKKK